MKILSQGLTILAILCLTACTKENLSMDESSMQPDQFESSLLDVESVTTTPIGFDDEVYDVPFQINTAITYTPTGGTLSVLDNAIHWFNGNYSNSIYATEDVLEKTPPPYEQIAIQRNLKLYSKECRLPVASGYSDTIQLVTRGYRYTSYNLRLEPAEFPAGFNIAIYDTYLSSSSTIAMTGTTFVPFTVSGSGNSQTRFKLIVSRN